MVERGALGEGPILVPVLSLDQRKSSSPTHMGIAPTHGIVYLAPKTRGEGRRHLSGLVGGEKDGNCKEHSDCPVSQYCSVDGCNDCSYVENFGCDAVKTQDCCSAAFVGQCPK